MHRVPAASMQGWSVLRSVMRTRRAPSGWARNSRRVSRVLLTLLCLISRTRYRCEPQLGRLAAVHATAAPLHSSAQCPAGSLDFASPIPAGPADPDSPDGLLEETPLREAGNGARPQP